MTIHLSDDQKIKLLNSDDVYKVMQYILLREEQIDQEKEHFWMIGLANNNRILYIELVSLGSVNATTVEPMNVFRVAVLKGAVKVIVIHNHPSGELKPSDQDKDVTDRLIQVGNILNIKVIDHLIISTRSYMSFADTGLFEQLEKSTKWVPQFELVERIKKEEKRLREEAVSNAVTTERQAIAKKLKQVGVGIEDISKATGLPIEEVEKIKMKGKR
ncbi:MAG: JAB domain-containing protein [Bacteroidota bacterium]